MTPFPSIALILAFTGPAPVPQAERLAREIAPFVGEEVAVVVHLDLARLDVGALARRVLGGLGDDEETAAVSQAILRWIEPLRRAGAKEVFLLASPADALSGPVVVVPLAEGADAKAIGQALCGGGAEKPARVWPTCATIHNAVFAGTPAALERARRPVPGPRPGLAAAFAASGDSAARLLILPGADLRRVVEEMIPTLPHELGGGPITILTHGVVWASLALEAGPEPSLRVVVQSRDADSARALVGFGGDAVKLIARSAKAPLPRIAEGIARQEARVVGDRVVLDLDLDRTSALVNAPLRSAHEAALRSRCVNNLKQIGLAFHNYHSARNAFPPAFSRDKQGRPLLSWRVAILPYIEQQALYNEFHLDEPWDSPHNKTLIEKIPPTFACPEEARKLQKAGKTTYLVPRGKATVFPDGAGVKISEITDGTSNTILVVDASDALAVIWTKPDDWEVDPEPKKDGLFGHHPGGTNFLYADGSVRFLKETIKPAVFRLLLTRNGGETLDPNDQ